MKIGLVPPLLLLGAVGHAHSVMAQPLGTSGAFRATGNMTTARPGHTATLLLNGKVLVAGGAGTSAELYDPSTGTFGATGDMTILRSGHTATLLADGRVLIAGGVRTSAELYDPSTGTFTSTGSMTAPHSSATLLKNGKVLMTGGSNYGTTPTGPPAELYDPATGRFTATGGNTDTGSLTYPGRTALLPEGRVLFIEPAVGCGRSFAQIFDPGSDKFSATGSPPYLADWYTATVLTSGNVLVAGGFCEDNAEVVSAKLYDAASGSFTATGDMITGRSVHTASLLTDGKVLITGGRAEHIVAHASAELYDTSTGTFRSTGNMTARRGGHVATLLSDSRVLITGGWEPSRGDILASAELYNPAVLVPAPLLFSLSQDAQGQGAIFTPAQPGLPQPAIQPPRATRWRSTAPPQWKKA
jgi:WD40 repeat protein